ncbi:uncharacterized protein LOC119735890 [Patiria miniata]|uniref:Ig-like domain-containing protein n=1 Tax=Patiria miniata TaxID=46514 RepID=A0A914APS8_PATMI|nr:uncharacterized protein LOC119735890 [Patiria miniata]
MNPLYALICFFVFGAAYHLSSETILTAVEGEDVELECKALDWAVTPPGNGTVVSFEWLVNKSAIVTCTYTKTIAGYTPVLNRTSGALTIPHVPRSLNGTKFQCQALHGGGNNNSVIQLIVFNGIGITETTSMFNGIIGGGIALECFVKSVQFGFPNINFKWLLGNKTLHDVCTEEGSTKKGKYDYHHDNRGCNLTINSLDLTDEGCYRCEAQYSTTTVWKNSTLTVNAPPKDVYIINATTGEVYSGDVLIRPDTDHSFTCLATDTKPPAEITCTFAGKNTSGETRVAGTKLHNTSSTFTVPSFQPGQRGNLTCTATGAGRKVVTNILLLSQRQESDPSMQSQMPLIFVAVGIAAALLLVLVAAIVFWKRRKNNVPSDGNQPVVHYTRTGTDRPTASVSPVLNTVVGPSDAGNIYEENSFLPSGQSPPTATPPSSSGFQATRNFRRYNPGNRALGTVVLPGPPMEQSDMPTSSNQQPAATISKEVLIYADVHHTKTHPLDVPPIRTEPPTQYADINNFLILTPVEIPPLFRDDAPSLGVEGQSFDGLEEEAKEERAPPRPVRGNPIPYLVRDWQM